MTHGMAGFVPYGESHYHSPMGAMMNGKKNHTGIEKKIGIEALKKALYEAGPEKGLTMDDMSRIAGLYTVDAMEGLGDSLCLTYRLIDAGGKTKIVIGYYADRPEREEQKQGYSGFNGLNPAEAENSFRKMLSDPKGSTLDEIIKGIGEEYTNSLIKKYDSRITVDYSAGSMLRLKM